MPRYRVTTPDTPRCPGREYADFARATETTSAETVASLMEPHGYEGCAVWRRTRAHNWRLIFDRTYSYTNRRPGAEHWQAVK